MKKASNSNLNHRILITLSSKPTSSVTALARDLELLRPSVSRAVNTLQNAGFITRQGRTLLLTEAGQKEVQRLSAELPAKVKKTADQATRILEQIAEQQKQMEAITNSPSTQAIQALITSPGLRAIQELAYSPGLQAIQELANSASLQAAQALINSPSLRAAQALASSASLQLHRAVLNEVKMSTQLAGTIASIAQIQRINLDILQIGRLPFSSLGHLFIENNVFISRMIADLVVIARVDIGLNSSLESLRHLTIEAIKAYDAHFRKVSNTLVDEVAQEQALVENLEMELVIPTTTTSSLVGSTRNIIRAQFIPQSEEPSSVELTEVRIYSQQYLAMSSLLEHYLKPLSRRFVSKWHGAWQTLASESQDRYSQAMHSGRELLIQILAHLAPDELFTEEEIARNNGRPPTRRMRIGRILDSHSKAEWVDKTAAALDSTYDVLAAESHYRDEEYRDDDTAAGQLIVLGGLLLTLLSRRSSNPS